MEQAIVLEREITDSSAATIAAITERLPELAPEQLEDVLQFVQFLEFKYCLTPADPSEDRSYCRRRIATSSTSATEC